MLKKNYISVKWWQPEFLMESNSVIGFKRGPPKAHSCKVWSKLAEWFGRRRCLKKVLTTHETRGPRQPWIAHLIFWDCSSHFFLLLSEKNLQEFLYVCTVQEASIHLYHVYWQIKISRTILKRVTQGTFLWDYFKIWPIVSEMIFYVFVYVHIVK